MIAHIVLFRPRADLRSNERQALIDSFGEALREIPSIRRARVGKRLRTGRSYESSAREDYPYAAVLEFDDVTGLTAYLDHPSHARLAGRFGAACDAALMYDFDLREDAAELPPEPVE